MDIGTNLINPESGWVRKYCKPANAGSFFKGVNLTGNTGWFPVGADYQAEGGNAFYATAAVPSPELSFTFFGTGLRIMAGHDTIPLSEYLVIKINGSEEQYVKIFSKTPPFTVVYENLKLENKEHTVTIRTSMGYTGKYTFLYAIDYFDPTQITKGVSLYKKQSGKIFVDDFDSINPEWIISPSDSFSIAARKGFIRLNHTADKDVMLLINKPEGDIAIQVIADYTPDVEGDKGGLIIYQNADNKIEFLESHSINSSKEHREWLATSTGEQWDFYSKVDATFDYADSDKLEATKIGVVLKKGVADPYKPLDIDRIIITSGHKLKLRQLFPNNRVILKDENGTTLSINQVGKLNTGIDINLPSLEFQGTIEVCDEQNSLIAEKKALFYGGDIYNMGSPLKIIMDSKELNDTDPTNLGNMIEEKRIIKMMVQNENSVAVHNLKISIEQYMERVGYTWADISLDKSNWADQIAIGTLGANSYSEFWVLVTKDLNYIGFEPILFNIKLQHD